MPATYTSQKIGSKQAVVMHDFDPNATTVTAVSWRPIGQFRCFAAKVMRTIGTSATTFEIAVATAVGGTNATQVVAHAVGSEPDAVGDQLFLECDVEQMREVLAGATHWSPRISFATGTDEAAVVTIETDAQFPRSGLTVDIVA
jgi:hypothetical protein